MVEKDKIGALRKKLIKKAKEGVKEKYTGKDTHIAKAVNILEDLDSIFNLLSEQAREWYSIHFPELDRIVKSNESYMKLVFNIGERKEFSEKKVMEHYDNKDNAKKIVESSKNSIGSEIGKADLAELRVLALNALNIREQRIYLHKYIEESMLELMPNFAELCGGVIGAKILAKAGSIKRLAMMPSSTIQLIGAEKALFLAKKSGARGPKHGFLYQHPIVLGAKNWNKGKVARVLAGKLAIAAKEDYFGEKNISERLKKEVEKRAKAIDEAGPGKKKKKTGGTGNRKMENRNRGMDKRKGQKWRK